MSSSDSGLSLTCIVDNTSVASINGITVAIDGVGTATITCGQAGNDNYLPAEDISRTLTVASVTSLDKNQLSDLSIWPNPANDVLNVQVGEVPYGGFFINP